MGACDESKSCLPSDKEDARVDNMLELIESVSSHGNHGPKVGIYILLFLFEN